MTERILLQSFIEAFESQCVPETNVFYERYMFNRQAQKPGESINHYITDVIKVVENCQYGCLQDDLIRDKFISGIRDDKVREKLHSMKDLRLNKTIETLKTNLALQFRVRDMASVTQDEPIANVKRLPVDNLVKREGQRPEAI